MKEHRMTTATNHTPANTTEFPLPDGVWRVDPQRSEVGFAARDMWGLHTVRGVFGAYDGTLKIGAGGGGGELTIEAGSLDTGNTRRDRHLCSPTFFDVERRPRIVFTASDVAAWDGGLTMIGELAVGSSRVGLEIPVGVERLDDGTLRLEGTTAVSRKAAGVGWNILGVIRDDALLHADLRLGRAHG
jgi:polyisoprenoid-binding protein YceI